MTRGGMGSERLASVRKHAPEYPKRGPIKAPPGRVVGMIAVREKGTEDDEYNPLELHFTVSPYRKDYDTVAEQTHWGLRLPKYEQSLFHSCFKNW